MLVVSICSSLSAQDQAAQMLMPNVSMVSTQQPQQLLNQQTTSPAQNLQSTQQITPTQVSSVNQNSLNQNSQAQVVQNSQALVDHNLGDISNIVATDHALDQQAFDQHTDQAKTQSSLQQAQAQVQVPTQTVPTTPITTQVSTVPQTPAAPIFPGAQTEKITQIPEDKQDKNAKEKEEANIYLNFENVSLGSVLNYLAEQKNINILPIKELDDTKVSLTTRTPLTLTRAWNILLTLLEINNLSIIKVGNLYRVVSSKDNGQQPLPTYSSASGTEPEDLPDSDLVVRYVYFFKNIKTDMAHGILGKMIDDAGIIENKDLNACIIKERCLNIKAAMKVVKALDMGGLREEIAIIALKWANAQTVEQLFKDISGSDTEDKTIRFLGPTAQKEKTYFSSATKIISDPIKNNLVLLGTSKNIARVKNFIYKYIDVPIGDAESRLHVKEIRYAKAEDLQPILTDIIKPPKGTADKAVVSEGGYRVFEDVIIAAETADVGTNATARAGGNRLIIACNRDDWKRLEEFIEKLDKPQPQIAIEVMVINVQANLNRQLGAQQFLLKGKAPGLGINSGQAGLEFRNLSSGTGVPQTDVKAPKATSYVDLANDSLFPSAADSTWVSFGRATQVGQNRDETDNIWGIIQSIYNLKNSHVISQPFLVANNYQECTVNVGETKLIPGPLESGTVNLQPKVVNITKPIKNQITLTPYINSTGNVDLKIEVILQSFTGTSGEDTNTATVNTRASMASGEVLVLGGFTESDLTDTTYETPILSKIPLLGMFFKSKQKQKSDSNLYIFIRPSIIKPRFEGNPDEYTQLKLDYSKYQLVKNDTYARDNDPIQRWFFKPSHQSVKQKLSDAQRGVFRPIDDFAYGKERPMAVNMQEDPYFKVSESIAKFKQRREATQSRKHS